MGSSWKDLEETSQNVRTNHLDGMRVFHTFDVHFLKCAKIARSAHRTREVYSALLGNANAASEGPALGQ